MAIAVVVKSVLSGVVIVSSHVSIDHSSTIQRSVSTRYRSKTLPV